MRSQDRFLSEMTISSGGSLALVAHNIHVADGMALGEEMDVVRESYGTRRKTKIEHLTFDTLKNYAVVVEPPKKRVETGSDTSDEEDIIPQLPVRNIAVQPESRCRPKSRSRDDNISQRSSDTSEVSASKEKRKGEVHDSVKDVDEFLDGLVEMLDGNNNVEDELRLDDLEIDENILTDGLLHSEVLDMLDSHQNIVNPDAAGLSVPNRTLDTDT